VSRGPGKWQRGILGALKAHPAVFLTDLLPETKTRSDYSALYRAAQSLARGGAIAIWQGGLSHSPLVLARCGYSVTKISLVPRLNVESVPPGNQVNTYSDGWPQ
jgi:hypothetical protein